MNVLEIPFVEKIGIKRNADGNLELPYSENVHNHLHTIHASAQFTLAETASGEMLQHLFPELAGVVIPVLRESNIKFKKPATNTIIAYPSVSDETLAKFKEQFIKRGRASISVDVEIRDTKDTVTCVGAYNWFVQKASI